MSFMEPETCNGGYWHIETWGGSFVVPDDVLEGAEPTADNLAQYMPEGIGMTMGSDANQDRSEWTIEHRVGWYGRMSAPGYLDCTDWVTANTEEELLASLRDPHGDDDEPDQGYWRIVTRHGVACVDADLVPAIEPTPADLLPHMPPGHQLPDPESGDPADAWTYEYFDGPTPDSSESESHDS